MKLSIIWRILGVALAGASGTGAAEALKLHPENPKYFLFRGQPLVLISASEHYGSIINRPFDFEKYLDDAAAHKMTLTRTFLLYRELQSAQNPSSPCKPESPDFIAPFPRTGPGKALDGEPKYDLDQWNPEYFERVHRFLDAASRRGIVVELTLFSNTYDDATWSLNPFRAENNLQRLERIVWPDYQSQRHPELLRRQKDYLRKIVQETSGYDNVYYEICNEPGGSDLLKDHASPSEVDAWQAEMARVVREELRRLNRPHLIAGQQGGIYEPSFRIALDATFAGPVFDIVNVHPLPDTDFGGRRFQMGNFFSKELALEGLSDFARAVYPQKKPVVMDEDNVASLYRDPTGWTIHRKRAWVSLFSGAHYDYIDFSITVGSEAGNPASRALLRTWMQHLSEFMASFDFVHAVPNHEWVQPLAPEVRMSGLAAGENDYVAYLADAREVTDPAAGEPVDGTTRLILPAGRFEVSLYSPVSGGYSPAIFVTGGAPVELALPRFRHDVVVRARRVRAS